MSLAKSKNHVFYALGFWAYIKVKNEITLTCDINDLILVDTYLHSRTPKHCY